ncbi:MAG: hypothetical protein IT196_15325 [Acidimicrobiales bacterium]|nr:hypothetical protein [Acidimicrobiales bacterium]
MGVPAPTAEAAVRAYLDAEVRRDYATSFAQLGAADRRAAVDPIRWAAMHSQLPSYTSYRVDATAPQVATTVAIQPVLDEVVGLVPSEARITWSTVQEDGGYRISLNASRFDPVFPPDADAPSAVLAWMQRQQACDHRTEYAGSFIGPTSLSDRLCKLRGTFSASDAKPLDAYANSTAVVTAFGPEATTWARVVTLTGPGHLEVVAAPLGKHWVVIGATGSLSA